MMSPTTYFSVAQTFPSLLASTIQLENFEFEVSYALVGYTPLFNSQRGCVFKYLLTILSFLAMHVG
jgi:hypothetical protein